MEGRPELSPSSTFLCSSFNPLYLLKTSARDYSHYRNQRKLHKEFENVLLVFCSILLNISNFHFSKLLIVALFHGRKQLD